MTTSRFTGGLRRPGRPTRGVLAALLLLAGTLAAAGCGKAQAKAVPDGPPLEMPAPPPRVLGPLNEPLAAAPAEPAEPAAAAPSTTRRPPRRNSNGPSDAEQKPAQPSPVEVPQSPPENAPEPARTTLQVPGRGGAEDAIRDRLGIAQRDLSRVDYARLSYDGRAQYEQSKRFIQQAEQALKDQNLVFAATLADKAATLAAELLGR